MSGFRAGDRTVEILGERRHLRLSLSALAEIASELEAESPQALAARLRRASPADWHIILRALSAPPPDRDLLAGELSDGELAGLMPVISAVISEGFQA